MPDQFQSILQQLDRISEEFGELRQGIRRAVRIADEDPEMALTRARKVLEYVVRDVFKQRCQEDPGTRPLENLIERLRRDGHMPRMLIADADHIRALGNVGVHGHGERVTAGDVKRCLEELMTILEWYFERVRPEGWAADGPAPGATRVNQKDGMIYVWIPPGKFRMGCSLGDDECFDEEKPTHQVEITRGFWIGQTPVNPGVI